MKNQFWAGLGSWAILVKKKFGADFEQLLSAVFSCFHGQKKIFLFFYFFKHCKVRNKKLHKIKVKQSFKKFVKNFIFMLAGNNENYVPRLFS